MKFINRGSVAPIAILIMTIMNKLRHDENK
jgi:hypothetical protein